jgi:hypothetical protein
VTDFDFAHSKSHPSDKFTIPYSLRRRGYLVLHWFAAPRAFTSGAPHPRFSERENATANFTLKQVLPALALAAKLRFAPLARESSYIPVFLM